MAVLNERLSGSSLVEVLVAMVIIALVFGLAMTFFGMLGKSERSAARNDAWLMLNEAIASTSSPLVTSNSERDHLYVEHQINELSGRPDVVIHIWQAFDLHGKLLAERKRIEARKP